MSRPSPGRFFLCSTRLHLLIILMFLCSLPFPSSLFIDGQVMIRVDVCSLLLHIHFCGYIQLQLYCFFLLCTRESGGIEKETINILHSALLLRARTYNGVFVFCLSNADRGAAGKKLTFTMVCIDKALRRGPSEEQWIEDKIGATHPKVGSSVRRCSNLDGIPSQVRSLGKSQGPQTSQVPWHSRRRDSYSRRVCNARGGRLRYSDPSPIRERDICSRRGNLTVNGWVFSGGTFVADSKPRQASMG
jgi:hypothetical protein